MTTQTLTVTVGWTKSDMSTGYSSYDGYRPGAEQHTETITVAVESPADSKAVAEAVFEATNSPCVRPNDGSLAGQVLEALVATGYHGQGAHWSLSVGDTVTVDGLMLAVERFGFSVVEGVAA